MTTVAKHAMLWREGMKLRPLIPVLLSALVIAHPLSMGLFLRMEKGNIAITSLHWMGGMHVYYEGWDIYHGIYAPELALCRLSPQFDHAMQWWASFWLKGAQSN
jgi:hypothetical protein